MTPEDRRRRLEALIADERANALSLEEAAELEAMRRDPALAAVAEEIADELDAVAGIVVSGLGRASDPAPLPDALRGALVADGRRIVGGGPATDATTTATDAAGPRRDPSDAPPAPRARDSMRAHAPAPFTRFALAAAIILLITGGIVSVQVLRTRTADLEVSEARVRELERRIADNADLLAAAQATSDGLQDRNLDLARQLAMATADLDDARDRIAMYEAPVDPAVLARNRTRLLEVPDVVQVAWAPFDLGDDPAEQPEVTGDVVWSPSRGEGYLRFVGLAVNDPAVEQYQVWVIDERGMEQKVSGGVFDATAEGEVIVPIDPAIDVGRVQLFAVTIEEPGGIWVPDLSRRVTIAPVSEG